VDVCRVLERAEPHRVASRLDDDEKGVHPLDTPGGPQEVIIINESGLWKEILRSRKPTAKRFTKWVTGDLLPTLRKAGTYSLPSAQQQSSLATDPAGPT
jgi:prophage antirepressor-like protein